MKKSRDRGEAGVRERGEKCGGPSDALRQRAQARLGAPANQPADSAGPLDPDAQRLVHELQVHQIELELQNEALTQTRAEAEAALARYTDLYEHAPVGFLTLARDGELQQVNLAAERLLGWPRIRLVGRRLGALLAVESRPGAEAWLARIFTGDAEEICEVLVTRDAAAP